MNDNKLSIVKAVKYYDVKNIQHFTHPYRYLVFTPDIDYNIFMSHYKCVKSCIHYAKLLKEPNIKHILNRQIKLEILECYKKPFTLFLDIDETLVCIIDEITENYIEIYGKIVYFRIRPYCLDFLKNMSKIFQIIIFTAATFDYANAIVEYLDPDKLYICNILSREECLHSKNSNYIKDLRICSNIDIDNSLIIDNNAMSFSFQIDNGIPILSFDGYYDSELKYIQSYLRLLVNIVNIKKETSLRIENNKYLQLKTLCD